jgi:hypothetical protein
VNLAIIRLVLVPSNYGQRPNACARTNAALAGGPDEEAERLIAAIGEPL